MNITKNIEKINSSLSGTDARLIAVTKTKPIQDLQEAYQANCKIFGENKVQEMVQKWEVLPKDIEIYGSVCVCDSLYRLLEAIARS